VTKECGYNRTNVLIFGYIYIEVARALKVLRLAIEKKRWDLVAHIIVLSSANALGNGDKPHIAKKKLGKKGSSKTLSKRTIVKTGGKRV